MVLLVLCIGAEEILVWFAPAPESATDRGPSLSNDSSQRRLLSTSTRPTISLTSRNPSSAMIMRSFFSDHEQVIHDVLGLAGELLAQFRILSRYADRTGIQVTLAHHDAAERDERRGRKAEFFGPEESGDRNVAAGLQLAVRLQHHAATQVVHHQRLMRLGDAEFPWHAGVLDRRQRRRTGAAGVAGDDDVIGVRLRDAGGDRADADLRRRASR